MVSAGTLVETLADDLTRVMSREGDGVHRSVVLLLDPDGQFSRLMPDLRTELEDRSVGLLILERLDEQFTTKMALIGREATGVSTVVYAPGAGPDALNPKSGGAPPDLWGLVDYRHKGVVWDGTDAVAAGPAPAAVALDRWLERHAVTFPEGSARSKLVAGGRDSQLARFAARLAHRRFDSLPRPLTEASVRDELAGDPHDSVIQLLLDPSRAISAWGDNRDDVFDRIGTVYGLRYGAADPELTADEVAAALAITDAWDAFGRADDFPFTARLPRGPQQRERTLALLRSDLLHRADVLPRFRARIARLEPELSAIGTWAADKPGLPAALPQLLERRVRRLLDRLRAAWANGPAACLDVLDRDLAADEGPENAHASLSVLYRVRQLANLAQEARDESVLASSASKLVDRYSAKWWNVDALYLSVAAACRKDADLVMARELANRVYFEYLDAVNQRFSDLVELDGSWPPVDTHGVGAILSKVWASSAKTRQAVLIIDALRFDLARQVADGLGTSATLDTVLTTLPTTTPFGMAALMPAVPGEPAVSYDGDRLSISAGGRSDLHERTGRKGYLESFLAGRDRSESVAFAELEGIVQGAAIPKARWLVVFSYALDDRGHSLADSASLPEEAPKLVARLVRAIQRLHQEGIARVDVVTDHGFIYLAPELTDSLGHPDLPPKQALSKSARYAILQPDVATTEVMRRASPMAPGVTLGFPRGIRTLSKATVYLHGGISLQECVIGRISSQASLAVPRVEADIEVAVSKITGATIPIRIRPVGALAAGQMTLDAPRPIKVRFSVDAASEGSVVDVADPITLEVRADTPELVSALYLRPGITLKAGVLLSIRALDADTGESLFAKQVPLVVDWEG